MANPFVAEIRIFPFNFPPTGWAFCDGPILPLSQNTALFSLLGTTYGGDGTGNFAGNTNVPTGNAFAKAAQGSPYVPAANTVALSDQTIAPAGGDQPHNN